MLERQLVVVGAADMRLTSLLCPTNPPGIRPTSGEQAVRRWWQAGTLIDGFDVYYEETLYDRASDWMRPMRGLPWP